MVASGKKGGSLAAAPPIVNEPAPPNALDTFIKYAAPLLAIATTGLSLYVAITTRETNQRLAAAQAASSELKLNSERYDLAPRLVVELGAQNAAEFAAGVRQRQMPMKVLDATLESQLVEGSRNWSLGRHLMTGAGATGLYLRQIVYVRITNFGKTATSELKLVVRQKDFGLTGNGTQVKRFGELDTQGDGWTEHTLAVPDLMEQGAESQGLASRLLIPLAQVSGGEYYFGRVLVPVKFVWTDKRQGKVEEMPVRVAQASALDNQLLSAILGMSTSSIGAAAASR